MPLNIDYVQILLHMLNFVILAGGLTLILFNPVKKFMNERKRRFEEQEEKNRKDAEENERLRAEYEQRKADFEKEMADMRRKTEKETADAARAYIESCRKEAASILEKAERDAEKHKEQILDSAQTEIGEFVIGAAQKLLGDTATPERTKDLYDAFLRQSEADAAKEKKS